LFSSAPTLLNVWREGWLRYGLAESSMTPLDSIG